VPRVTQFTRRFIDVEAEAAAQDAATSA